MVRVLEFGRRWKLFIGIAGEAVAGGCGGCWVRDYFLCNTSTGAVVGASKQTNRLVT